MHIAICNDNVADRKQLERLLARESDKRISTTGNLYVDSFGHPDSLLNNPMQYDAFFLDMESTPDTSDLDILTALVKAGCTSPVVLFYTSGEEKQKKEAACKELPLTVLTMEKPVKVQELSDLLDRLITLSGKRETPIELREEGGTHYVYEQDILYVEKKGSHIYVTLKNGDTVLHNASSLSLFSELESYSVFFAVSSKVVLNSRYLSDVRPFHITMCDGRSFRAYGASYAYARKIFTSKPQQ